MKRYYILMNKYKDSKYKPICSLWFDEWLVVPTWGEPIGDNCFYRKMKWCGKVCYWLYDVPTGTYICIAPTLEDLQYHVESEVFKNELNHVRRSKFYSSMIEHFNKAME